MIFGSNYCIPFSSQRNCTALQKGHNAEWPMLQNHFLFYLNHLGVRSSYFTGNQNMPVNNG